MKVSCPAELEAPAILFVCRVSRVACRLDLPQIISQRLIHSCASPGTDRAKVRSGTVDAFRDDMGVDGLRIINQMMVNLMSPELYNQFLTAEDLENVRIRAVPPSTAQARPH